MFNQLDVALDSDWPESAPLRDFAAPQPYQHQGATVALALTPAQQQTLCQLGHACSDALLALLLACTKVLLARHTGQTDVALAVRGASGSAAQLLLRSRWAADASLAALVAQLSARLAAGQSDAGRPCPVALRLSVDGASAPAWPEPELAFEFEWTEQSLNARLDYNALLYQPDSAAVLARQWTHLMGVALQADATQPIHTLTLHDNAERQRLSRGLSGQQPSFAPYQTLSELIEQQVRCSAHQTCVIHHEQRLSYAALNARANQLAGLLRQLGVGPGQFVAILEPRGLHFVTAMLAIWKAGAAYVPIEPNYPPERVRYMLTHSEVPVVLVGQTGLARLRGLLSEGTPLRAAVCLDALTEVALPGSSACALYGPAHFGRFSVADGPALARATDAAYMIYTSGSTGQPKGAIVRHDGAVNHILAQTHSLGVQGVRRFLQTAPSSSDISVWQLAAPLVLGGVSVIIDSASDVEELAQQAQRHRVSLIEVVPVVLQYLIAYLADLAPAQRALPDLRWLMVTGESVSVELVNAWLALYPTIAVVNAYGPTEAADDVCQAIIRAPLPERQLRVPIGWPLANVALYVLDEHFEPLPVGVPGEICVAGVGVGNGYWRQPDKTRERFSPNPFATPHAPVLYRTGDRGRLRDDGCIECLGREDSQIQLNGFRIELGEIEAAARRHPQVKEAVVVVTRAGSARAQLVAFVLARPQLQPESAQVRRFMAACLPTHMVPALVLVLAELPLTPAGKVDQRRLALLALAGGRVQSGAVRGLSDADLAPNQVAQILARLWCEEFGLTEVGLHDNFFDLGGDSLSAVALVAGARHARLHLRPSDIFEQPTLAQLAEVVTQTQPEARPKSAPVLLGGLPPGVAHDPRLQDAYALSPTQQGIYLHALLSRDKSVYVDQYCFVLHGALDAQRFEASWNRVLQRHPALRAAVSRRHTSRPLQVIWRDVWLPLQQLDGSAWPPNSQPEQLAACRNSELGRGFNLETPPLMRLLLVRLAPERHYLIWTHHHLILDGWAMTLVLGEVLTLMHDDAAPATETPAPPSHRRYVDWLHASDNRASRQFWQQSLAGYQPGAALVLPAPVKPELCYAEHDVTLSPFLTKALTALAQAHRVTLGTVLHAAWALLLARWSGRDDVVFGMVSSGREGALEGVQQMVGLLITTLPLRLNTAASGSDLGTWLRQVQRAGANARCHDTLALGQIQHCSELAAGQALFETLLVMANYPALEAACAPGLVLEAAHFRTVPAYALTLLVVPGAALSLRLVYDQQRCDSASAGVLLQQYQQLLNQLVNGEDARYGAQAQARRAA